MGLSWDFHGFIVVPWVSHGISKGLQRWPMELPWGSHGFVVLSCVFCALVDLLCCTMGLPWCFREIVVLAYRVAPMSLV